MFEEKVIDETRQGEVYQAEGKKAIESFSLKVMVAR